ncbi:Uncharacterized protein SCF082_LOCUS28243 [Durusdinium trenchii]|uniref:Uncharacterized protein n=1 Tax=Durusdinium trenchii TaxID=1381693 RepID=A0ABP0ML95_9DINO
MQLYAEHAPTPAPTVATDAKINAADDQVTDLCKDARRAQFAADSLSLARDTAQLGMLYNEVSKSEAAERTEKVLHLKNQNAIGASIVADFMTGNLAIHSGPVKDQLNLLERFLTRSPGSPTILWCDLMKCGRLTATDVHDFGETLSTALNKRPESSCAIVVAPHLTSEKVLHGHRGELRRLESKFDAKNLWSEAISIRCCAPPAQRRVPIQFDAWIVISESKKDENWFMTSQLVQDRATRTEIPWQSESGYVVPVSERDSLPSAAEGQRSLSDVQEAAQFLAGESLPRTLLQGILCKSKVSADDGVHLNLVNLTPYDGWLERVGRRWKERETPSVPMKIISLTKSLSVAQYVEKTIALELMQEWKAGNLTCLGKVRRYEAKPPPALPGKESDVNNFPLRIVKLEVDIDPTKRGWSKFKISIPVSTRMRYADDAIHGQKAPRPYPKCFPFDPISSNRIP